MLKHSLSLTGALLLFTANILLFCKTPSNTCIDPKKINPEALCTMQYDPVCGCDNKTYSNACNAERAGLTSFTKGACPE